MKLIRFAQYTKFREERISVSRGRPLPANSKHLGLQQKLDDDGLMLSVDA